MLAPLTSFGVGGPATTYYSVNSHEDLMSALKDAESIDWLLGYGSNSLISDKGLPGTTLHITGGEISRDNDQVIADAGVWFDDVVEFAVSQQLWGLELLSAVPGNVGGSVFINITAYGQSIGEVLDWIEVWDPSIKRTKRLKAAELNWSYKYSFFQEPENKHLVILRVAFKLSPTQTKKLTYKKATEEAAQLGLDPSNLDQARQIILATRRKAGSIWEPNKQLGKTAGSFFRNPVVTKEQAEYVMGFDETHFSKTALAAMNKVHGGSEYRVSAAHVLLAAGYRRGQSWGNVRLHSDNVLKIENTGGATAQEIYDVAMNIANKVKQDLNIVLTPEVQILGEFEPAAIL